MTFYAKNVIINYRKELKFQLLQDVKMIIQIDIEQNLLEKFQNTANNWNISLSELLIKSTNEKIDSNKLI